MGVDGDNLGCIGRKFIEGKMENLIAQIVLNQLVGM